MPKIKEGNHFVCLLVNGDKCPVGFLGQPMCEGCRHLDECSSCGKKNTQFCMHCNVSKPEGQQEGCKK